MNTRYTPGTRHRAAALVLALATTLAVLSGVNSLWSQSPDARAVLAQAQTAAPQS